MSNERYYLLDNPPARTQFRRVRRADPTGCIVLHTAENATDITGGDRGAEAVASFISSRTDAAGSYHRVGDRDSIVSLVPFSFEAFHDGTGSNPWSIGLSLAMRAADWPTLSTVDRDAYLAALVKMAVDAAEWLQTEHGIRVPAAHITKAQSDAGHAGFIGHGERDPERRSDPGADFPWERFLSMFTSARKIRNGGPMPTPDDNVRDEVRWWQSWLNEAAPDLVPLTVDGRRGPLTEAHAATVKLRAAKWVDTDPDEDQAELLDFARRAIELFQAAGRFGEL